MKSLQLHGRRQIAEPRKYCLMRVIVFFCVCVFLYFFVSHRLGIRVNSLQEKCLESFFGKWFLGFALVERNGFCMTPRFLSYLTHIYL